jgi:hypothetical protein
VKAGEAFMSGQLRRGGVQRSRNTKSASYPQDTRDSGRDHPSAIDARYYFGEPVNGAKVTYAIFRERYWFPLWYDPEDDPSMEEDRRPDDDDGGDQIGEQEGQLDADGKLTVTMPTTVSDRKFDYRYRIEARVSDAPTARSWAAGGWWRRTASVVLNAAPERYSTRRAVARRSASKRAPTTTHRCARVSMPSCCDGTIASR